MSLQSTAVPVLSTATLVYSTINGQSGAPAGVSIYNNGSQTVYLGGPNVTIADGFPLGSNEYVSVDLISGETLYGIADSTTEVRVLRTRV